MRRRGRRAAAENNGRTMQKFTVLEGVAAP
jgi:hypothetical protein